MRTSLACPAVAILAAAFLLPPAHAAACDSADATRAEKAICTDPAVQAVEAELDAAAAAAAKALPDEAAMIEESQTRWRERRNGACDAEEAAACIIAKTRERIAYLTVTPDNGPGFTTPPLVPDIRVAPAEGEACGADIAIYRFGIETASPAAGEAKKAIAAFFAALQSNLGPNSPDASCSYSAEGRLAFASPEVVNIAISWFGQPAGGYSGMGWWSVFADMKSGKLLTFADLFADTARVPLNEACTAALRDAKIARLVRQDGGAENADMPAIIEQVDADMAGRADQIAARVGDLENWRVTEVGATVDFAFSAGVYMEGTFECALPKALLQKVAGPRGWIAP